MLDKQQGARLANLWDETKAAGMSEAERLLYRSNLLGSDKRITNYGGGNTSAKVMEKDPLGGGTVEVLWVKGSGGDVGTIKMDGFATLYMDKLNALKGIYRGVAFEDEMVGYLPHCTFNLNPRAASIDTPLHAYVPKKHVDHMHPDAIIAIAASKNSRELTAKIFGNDIGWLPWKRPGYELGLWLEKFCLENPSARGVVLESHGLFTWGDTAREAYETTVEIINKAIAWFETENTRPAFGGVAKPTLDASDRVAIAKRLMPVIRGLISADERKVGHFDDSQAVLDFVTAKDLKPLAALGTSCPDHFLQNQDLPACRRFRSCRCQTSKRPLPGLPTQSLPIAPITPPTTSAASMQTAPPCAIRTRSSISVPGVGMITFAKDKATARISGEFYVNAINVMRGASGVSTYVGLPEQEAFDIEYWLLEEAKLQRMPKPKSLAGTHRAGDRRRRRHRQGNGTTG